MNLILFSTADRIGANRVRFTDRRLQQIREVHNSGVGDSVRVGELGGLMGRGEITAIDEQSVELDMSLDTSPPPKLPLTLLLALPRPKMLRRILRNTAELGVQRLVLLNSYRVQKSYWSSPLLQAENIERYLLDGLQQARDTVLPDVQLRQRFKPFVEDELPELAADTNALIAHPGSANPCPQPLNRPATLAIGPEGGFISYEVEKLQQGGFEAVDLGPRILRVDTAMVIAVGKLFGS